MSNGYTEDERVVSMLFDDKDFQRGAKRSMKTLDELEEKLAFKDVDKESEKTLNKILDAVNVVATKSYGIIDRVTDEIKNRIVNKITDGITNVIKDSTIGQLDKGFQKFSEKTTSVGTLVAQGNSLELVNEQLEKLNWFTDETSYNFVDMVSNISKFTATGQSLEDATTAMMGIANWAAVSGQNASTASRAMYQLSQALGAGYMRKEDYKSIQNVSMDTDEFRQKAIDAAIAIGNLKDNLDGTYTSLKNTGVTFTKSQFAEGLTEGRWFDKDVMMSVYNEYGSAIKKLKALTEDTYDEVTGKIIPAAFDTASSALTYVDENNKRILSDATKWFKKEGKELKKEIKRWSELEEVTDEAMSSFADEYNVDIETAAERLSELNEYIDEFGIKAFKSAQEARTLGDALDSIKDAVSTKVMNIATDIFGDYDKAKALWTDLANWLYDVFATKFDDLQSVFDEWASGIGRNNFFRGIYGIFEAVKLIVEGFRELNDSEDEMAKKLGLLNSIGETIQRWGARIYTFANELRNTDFFQNMFEAMTNIRNTIGGIIKLGVKGITDIFPDLEDLPKLLEGISKWFNKLSEKFALSDEQLNNIRKITRALASIFKVVADIGLKALDKVLLPGLDVVLSLLRGIIDTIVEVVSFFGGVITELTSGIETTNEFSFSVDNLKESFKGLKPVVEKISNVFRKYVVPAFAIPLEIIREVVNQVKSFFNVDVDSDRLSIIDGLRKIKDTVLETWDNFDGFKQSIDKFKNNPGLIGFIQLVIDLFGNLTDAMAELLGTSEELSSDEKMPLILKIPMLIAGIASKIWEKLSWVVNNVIKPIAQEVVDILDGTIGQIIEALKEGDMNKVFDLINAFFETGILFKIKTFITNLNKLTSSAGLTTLVDNISASFAALKKELKGEAFEHFANGLLKLTVAIIALSAASVIISKVITTDEIGKVAIVFGVLIAGIAALSLIVALMSKIVNAAALRLSLLNISIAGFGVGLIGITASIFAVTAAVAIFKENALTAVGMLALLIESINLLMKTVSKSKKDAEKLKDIGIMIAGVGIGLLALSVAVSTIDISDKTIGDIIGIVLTFGALFAAIAGMAFILSKVGDVKTSTAIGIALAAAAISSVVTFILLPELERIADVSKDKLGEMMAAFGFMALTMLSISASLALILNQTKNFVSILSAAGAIKMVANVLTDIMLPFLEAITKDELKFEDYAPAVGTIAALLLVLAAAINVVTANITEIMNAAKDISVGKVLAIFANIALVVIGAMGLVSIGIEMLSNNGLGNNIASAVILIVAAIAPIAALVMAIRSIISTMKDENFDADNVVTLLNSFTKVIAVLIGGFIAAISVLSFVGTNGILPIVEYITAIMIPLAGMVAAVIILVKQIDKVKNVKPELAADILVNLFDSMTKMLIVISAGTAIISALSIASNEHSWKTIVAYFVSMAALMGILMYAMNKFIHSVLGIKNSDKYVQAITEYMNSISKMVIVLASSMVGIMAEMAIIQGVIGNKKMWLSFAGTAATMALMVTTVAGIAFILNKFNQVNLTSNAVKNVAALSILTGVITLCAIAISAFTKDITLSQGLSVALVLLSVVGAVSMLNSTASAVAANPAIFKVIAMIAALGGALYVLGAGLNKVGEFIANAINDGFTKKEKINSPSKVWKQYGVYMLTGLENGMLKEAKKLPGYAGEIASTLDETFCDFMGIHSPSRVMYENGRYVVQGLIDGMGSPYEEKRLQNKASEMGEIIGTSAGQQLAEAVSSSLENFDLFDGQEMEEFFKGLLGGEDTKKAIEEVAGTSIGTGISNALGDIGKWITGSDDSFIGDGLGEFFFKNGGKAVMDKKSAEKLGSSMGQFVEYALPKEMKSPLEKVGDWFKTTFGNILSSDSVIGGIVGKIKTAIFGENASVGDLKDELINGEGGLSGLMDKAGDKLKDKLVEFAESTELKSKAEKLGQILGDEIGSSLLLAVPKAFANLGTALYDLAKEKVKEGIYDIIHGDKHDAVKENLLTGRELLEDNEDRLTKNASGNKRFVAINRDEGPLGNVYIDDDYFVTDDEFTRAIGAFYNASGEDISTYIQRGLLEKKDGYFVVGQTLAYYLMRGITDPLEIQSPSKWMSDYVGPNLTKGLEIGIEDSSSNATNGIKSMCSDMNDELLKEFAIMDKYASNEVIAAPTLAPLNADSWYNSFGGANINGLNVPSAVSRKAVDNSDIINAIASTGSYIAQSLLNNDSKEINLTVTVNGPDILKFIKAENDNYYNMHGTYAL